MGFKIGDRVEIINYGHPVWQSKEHYPEETSRPVIKQDDKGRWIDIFPETIGKQGIVEKTTIIQGVPQYSIYGIGAWFKEGQMKMINKNPNR